MATDQIAQVRGEAYVAGVRIEVDANGRIIALESSDPAITQAVRFAHTQALAAAQEQVADIRRALADDPVMASAMRKLIEPTPVTETPAPLKESTWPPPLESWSHPGADVPNPAAHHHNSTPSRPTYQRDQVVGPTDIDDDDDPYYRRTSWLR
ncbi:hypothetical protein [Nocardia camponoti]|uniref:hypothetical protein n=1 Tax=Nocardia camponoti TaxID=1616106 RepID=UPI00166AC4AA|nr:hypothetical protein [Nocardia camponoti]